MPQGEVGTRRLLEMAAPPQPVGGQILGNAEQVGRVEADAGIVAKVEQARIGFLGDLACVLRRAQPRLQHPHQRLVEIADEGLGLARGGLGRRVRHGARRWLGVGHAPVDEAAGRK